MKINKHLISFCVASAALTATISPAVAQDPNFHIYLCIGQSNMEGNASPEPIDRQDVPERFKVMSAVDYNNPKRTKGEWYVAVPPLVRENTGLTPMDWFGRTMVTNLPEEVTIGVLPVAIGGCKIEHLDKDFDPSSLANEADWFKSYMACYGNHPYSHLIELAKKAQTQGVIKGILLHQGESNNCQQDWPQKVNKVYTDILTDLGLNAEDVPLFAGETVRSEMGGYCGGHNGVIATLPKTIPTSHVVSSANLPQKGDGLHFTAHGYRVLGCRYATEVLKVMGIEDPIVEYSEEIPFVPTPNPAEGDFVFDLNTFNPSIWENGSWNAETGVWIPGQYGFGGWEYTTPIDLSGYKYIVAELQEPNNGWNTSFRVFDTASYWEQPYDAQFGEKTLIVAELDGMMKNLQTGIVPLDTSSIYRVGFWGIGPSTQIKIKHVFATNNDPYDTAVNTAKDSSYGNDSVYDLCGRKIAESIDEAMLSPGAYIYSGKKFLVK